MANNWRGCKDIEMIWHGDWADPELVTEYDGVEYWFNYYDIENALWEDFLENEGIEEKDTYDERGNISDEYEDKFNKYCQDNAYTYITYDLIPSLDPDNYTKDGEKWFWIDSDVTDYNADLDSDEDDFDYDDIEESCGDKKKKKKEDKMKITEATDNKKTYLANFYSDVDVEIKASSKEEAEKIAQEMEGTTTDDGFYLSQFAYVYDDVFDESVNTQKKNLKEDINSGSKYPTSPTECLSLLASATKEFANAYLKLTEQWDMCDTYCQNDARKSGLDIDINDAMVDNYPFERSFDDYSLEVMEWSDSVIEELNNIKDTIEE